MISLKKHIDSLGDSEVILSFSGKLTIDVINHSLMLVEKRLLERKVKTRFVKKIYNVLVEGLQNIFHHGAKDEDDSIPALFSVSYDSESFKITLCNSIKKEIVEKLKVKLDAVNQMDKNEIVEEYRKVLDNGIVSEKGGSGLGFLDMKRKTKNNIDYNFFKDERHINFLVNLTIETNNE